MNVCLVGSGPCWEKPFTVDCERSIFANCIGNCINVRGTIAHAHVATAACCSLSSAPYAKCAKFVGAALAAAFASKNEESAGDVPPAELSIARRRIV